MKKPSKFALTIFLKTLFMVCKKNEFKYLLSLATTESYFIFSNKLYNQTDGVAMGFQLRPSLANELLGHHEQNWLDSCPLEYRVSYYRRYVYDIFLDFQVI